MRSFHSKLSLGGTFLCFALATQAPADTYVLVHGAFQDASAWNQVIPFLEAQGHTAVTVQLPGRDAQGAAAQAVSLESYIDVTIQVVERTEGPVHLVGHSFGGFTISGVAEAIPNSIASLVYVAAYVPSSGESMESLALTDSGNEFSQETFVVAPDYSYAEILAADQARVFANDGTEEQQARLMASMIREPLGPIATPITLSSANFGSVLKVYVRTLQDVTVSTSLQTSMIERAGIETFVDIDTGHAPYLTQPAELASAILMVTQ